MDQLDCVRPCYVYLDQNEEKCSKKNKERDKLGALAASVTGTMAKLLEYQWVINDFRASLDQAKAVCNSMCVCVHVD